MGHGNLNVTLKSLVSLCPWLTAGCVLASAKPIGRLEIVLALCGDCKLRKSFPSPSPQCFTACTVDVFFFHGGKRGADHLAADCYC